MYWKLYVKENISSNTYMLEYPSPFPLLIENGDERKVDLKFNEQIHKKSCICFCVCEEKGWWLTKIDSFPDENPCLSPDNPASSFNKNGLPCYSQGRWKQHTNKPNWLLNKFSICYILFHFYFHRLCNLEKKMYFISTEGVRVYSYDKPFRVLILCSWIVNKFTFGLLK